MFYHRLIVHKILLITGFWLELPQIKFLLLWWLRCALANHFFLALMTWTCFCRPSLLFFDDFLNHPANQVFKALISYVHSILTSENVAEYLMTLSLNTLLLLNASWCAVECLVNPLNNLACYCLMLSTTARYLTLAFIPKLLGSLKYYCC